MSTSISALYLAAGGTLAVLGLGLLRLDAHRQRRGRDSLADPPAVRAARRGFVLALALTGISLALWRARGPADDWFRGAATFALVFATVGHIQLVTSFRARLRAREPRHHSQS